MTERNIAAEVLDALREVREHRAGKRTLKTVRLEPRPLPELTPETIRAIRERLDVSRAVFAHMIRVPVRTVERWEQGRSTPPRIGRGPHPHGAKVPGYVRSARFPVAHPGGAARSIGSTRFNFKLSHYSRRLPVDFFRSPGPAVDTGREVHEVPTLRATEADNHRALRPYRPARCAATVRGGHGRGARGDPATAGTASGGGADGRGIVVRDAGSRPMG